MKKRIFTGLLLASTLTLVGCGSSGDAGSQDVTTLELFNIKVETKTQLEDLVKKYEELNPEVKINVTTVGGGSDTKAALQAKFSSGDEPNIFFSNGLSDTEKWLDKLADLSDLEAIEYAAEGTLDGATIDGKVYGVPNNVEGTTLIINKEIFDAAGVDYESISSFEEFADAMETIDSQKDDLGIDAAMAFCAKETGNIGQYATHFLAQEFDNSTAVAFAATELNYTYGTDFQNYTDLFNTYGVQPMVSLDYSTMVEDYFVNDRVAVIESGNWIVPTLDEIDPEFREKIDILPYFIGDLEPSVTASNGWYWTVNGTKSDSEVEESKKFLNWMYTDEDAKKDLVEKFNYIPAYTNVDDEIVDSMDSVSSGMYGFLKEGNATVWVDSSFPDGWAANNLGPDLQSYIDGKISWDELEQSSSDSWKSMRE